MSMRSHLRIYCNFAMPGSRPHPQNRRLISARVRADRCRWRKCCSREAIERVLQTQGAVFSRFIKMITSPTVTPNLRNFERLINAALSSCHIQSSKAIR